ncbi:hypothetical protein VNO78_31600 [Psophocarpus tetragonolobus]|uniref:Uncharacterized protein n=1 Tax=Psophocarpus tetragonolobus TaxID=3891 RepID=A0AAN9X8N5_PSOTE
MLNLGCTCQSFTEEYSQHPHLFRIADSANGHKRCDSELGRNQREVVPLELGPCLALAEPTLKRIPVGGSKISHSVQATIVEIGKQYNRSKTKSTKP